MEDSQQDESSPPKIQISIYAIELYGSLCTHDKKSDTMSEAFATYASLYDKTNSSEDHPAGDNDDCRTESVSRRS